MVTYRTSFMFEKALVAYKEIQGREADRYVVALEYDEQNQQSGVRISALLNRTVARTVANKHVVDYQVLSAELLIAT